MTNAFTVRACTDVKEAKKYFHAWAVSEHWDLGQDGLDVERVSYPCYPEGFFVGSVQEQGEEQVVSCICALKHGDIGYIAFYIVGDPRHRKKGYGFRTFQHALQHVSSCPWIGLCAVSAQVETYKRSGFVVQEPITRYAGSRNISTNKAVTVDLGSVPIEQLIALDHRYTGMYRPTFVTHWVRYHVTESHRYGLAIMDDQEQVVAFACMRRCESGAYRIAPVYADTSDHAYELVTQLTSMVDKEDAQFVTDINLANPAAEEVFANKLGWKPLPTMMTMYTMWRKGPGDSTGPPKLDPAGCFAMVAPEAG